MASSPIRVFVSHHHSPDEDAFTARLVADMEEAGADVWVDDARITSDDFIKKINEGLAGRQWLVLVMTPDALRSPWVQAEVNAALNQVRKNRMLGVIPVLANPCYDVDIPPLLDALHRYDATRDYQGAIAGLQRALGLAAPAPAAPRSPTPAQPSIPADRFPPRLASLGYEAKVINGVEVVLPPLCDVPAGEFLMGSDPGQDIQLSDNETPQHRVTLQAFQIARYPVTVAEYACFVRSSQKQPNNWQQQLATLDHPVVYVSWNDVVAYAAWLKQQTGQPWRLLSEAEWEKAARGTDGRVYPWGNQWDKARANTNDGSPYTATPVGGYAERGDASPYGVHDVAGNVWEWTSSLMQPYPYNAADGRESPTSAGNRVLRGGSWNYNAWSARAAFRYYVLPVSASYVGGFRLARSVPS
jgi:formylglycine-generating enzyme required for sulfatase activity